MIFFSSRAQVHIPAGNVSGTFFTVSSPYYIDGDVVVPHDSLLVIQPGVQIWFTGPYLFTVEGCLQANGTGDSAITWMPVADPWKGISFLDTDVTGQDTSSLSFCEITGCDESYGGALNLYFAGRTLFTGCEIHHNTAAFGAGAYLISSDATFVDCSFHDNEASIDGGGFNTREGGPSFHNCHFYGNRADAAGGAGLIYSGTTILIEGCSFENNVSYGSGAGLYARHTDHLKVRNSEFLGNICYATAALAAGGAIGIKTETNALVEYCSFNDNFCGTQGGAISTYSPAQIISCLFIQNTSLAGGGAIDIDTKSPPVGSVDIINCTFNENTSSQGNEILINYADVLLANSILWESGSTSLIHILYQSPLISELTVLYCDIRGGENAITQSGSAIIHWEEGNLSVDPRFADPAADDYHLAWNAPCIEAGDPSPSGYGLTAYDLDGNPRVVNDVVDMGCYEYQYPVNIWEETAPLPCQFSVFPVPCRDLLHIKTNELSYDARVYDLTGRLLLEEKDAPSSIDMSTLPPGPYVVRLTTGHLPESFVVAVTD